ncbi:MAG: hypothetical protein KKA42_11050 [candidate division Zixibacteria bacterium]|nr:hypothetical protein [candidate division Zixibacteria bacterium]
MRSPLRILCGLLVAGLACANVALAQDSEIDNETCLSCHDGYELSLESTAHRLTAEARKPATAVACVSCHGGAEVHVDDPSVDNIGRPQAMTSSGVEALCASCHQPHTAIGGVGSDPHAGQDISCVSCHTIHKNHGGLLKDDEGAFCGQCHVAAVNDFELRSSHPMTAQAMTCISCHDFTGTKSPDFGHGPEANCIGCHPQQSGPFMHEHQAASSFSPEGDGCLSCHNPHGSPNERLLAQPGDALCFQCHGTPPAHMTAHEGLATNYNCMDCHSNVHGSNDNQALLDPQLGTMISGQPDGCFCHNVGGF